MTFLQFNMDLNKVVTTWLEDGGDPARCADALRQCADEVFDIGWSREQTAALDEREEDPEADGYGNGGLTWAQAKAQGK